MWFSQSSLLFFTLFNRFLSHSECYFRADEIKTNREVQSFVQVVLKKARNSCNR